MSAPLPNFKVFYQNELTADVKICDNKVYITRYTTHIAKQIFAKEEMTLYELGEVIKTRCWDPNRDNIEAYLKKLGLTEFNIYEIVRHTHGLMFQDYIWFLFEGETITYDDIKIRD